MKRALSRALIAVCASLAGPVSAAPIRRPPEMRAHWIDVGQGAATLFEFSCGAALVDTGGEKNAQFDSAQALRGYLDAFFERRRDLNRTLDLVVITHPHIDHTRNVRLVAEEYNVKNVVTDGLTTSSGGRQQKWLQDWARTNARLETVAADAIPAQGKTSATIDPIHCADEDPEFRVLWGAVRERPANWTEAAFANANNQSVVVRIGFGRASFLLSGDLELAGSGALLAKYRGTDALDVDVWQVSHHGSRDAVSRELLAALTPTMALLATGSPAREVAWSAWQYGHPRKSALDLLSASVSLPRAAVDRVAGTKMRTFESYRVTRAVYATGWDGSVVVSAGSDGTYRVRTAR